MPSAQQSRAAAGNLLNCHRCPHRQRAGAGRQPLCLVNQRAMDANAYAGCPAGRFGPAGDATDADAKHRLTEHLHICRACPSGQFESLQPNGRYVQCRAAPRCCAGGVGEVSLAHGSCPKGYW